MNDSPVHSATYYYESDPPQQANQANQESNGQPAYDANGNLIQHKAWAYRYDAQNRLVWASDGTTTAEFYYDGKNRQIARNVGGTIRFSAWDGWELVEEYATGLQRTEGYLQGATGVIKTLVSNIYYYQDKLGTTTHVANASGQLLESYRYDLYGTPSYFNSTSQPINSSTVGITDLYAGERWVSELRVYDLRNRFMSPELGRFLQPDPIGFKGDASNLYRYCHNDPINKSDPTGLIIQVVGDDKYKAQVEKDLEDTRKMSPALGDSYKELKESPRTHTIKQPEAGKGNSNKAEGFWDKLKSLFGGKTGSTTYYDPNNRHTSYGDRDPKAALGHEFFGHALDRDRGTFSFQLSPPTSELRAIWYENEARRAIDGSQRSYDYYHPSVTYP